METFTVFHVVLSLVGIGSGWVVVAGLLASKRLDGWSGLFLASTVATSVTGFLFPFHHLLPSHVVGGISLVVLAIAIFARYTRRLAGPWGRTYVICAALALYLNVFVAVVQAFLKIPVLKATAPTQKEPPFLVTQLVVLLVFAGLTVLAGKKFHVRPASEMARRGRLDQVGS